MIEAKADTEAVSEDFPVSAGAFQKQHGGKGDAFLVKLELTDGP